MRRRLLAVRAARSPRQRAQAAAALAAHGEGLAAQLRAAAVAAYVGVGDEPDTGPLLAGLLAAGVRVLTPVVVAGGRLEWAAYTGPDCLRPAGFGLLEPVGPRLGPAALAEVDLLLVPALAVDAAGRRLGRGGGYYDRALAAAAAPAFAVIHDDELLAALPSEPHDRPVAGALRPAGVRWLSANGA